MTNEYIPWAIEQELPREPGMSKQRRKQELNIDLIHAAYDGDIEWIHELIKKGADINAKVPREPLPALSVACKYGNTELAKFLIEKGADVNFKNTCGFTALDIACFSDWPDTVKLLLEAGADINAKDNFGTTPLGTVKSSLSHEFSNAEDLAKVVKFLEDYVNTKSNKTLKEPISDKQKGASEIKFIDRGGITTKGISSSRS